MREIARIDRILALLEVYWKRNPDLRLGQVICNLCRRKEDTAWITAVFTYDDRELEAALSKEIDLLTRVALAADEKVGTPTHEKGGSDVK
jgi:hypothetical protein